MKRALAVVAALAVAYACQVPDEHFRVRDGGGSDVDAYVFLDADTGDCMHSADWGPLLLVAGLPVMQSVARFSKDELTTYYTFTPATIPSLFVATRMQGTSFGSGRALVGPNGSDGYGTPSISEDGATLIYTWGEPPTHPSGSDREIYRADRMGSNYQFGNVVPLSFNAAGAEDDFAYIASNGDVWFGSKRLSDTAVSIYRAVSVSGGFFGQTIRQDSLNASSTANNYPLITEDLHRIFFQRDSKIYTSLRISVDNDFPAPTTVDEINNDPMCAGTVCRPAWVSPDNCHLYIGVGSAGAVTMYMSAKPPRT